MDIPTMDGIKAEIMGEKEAPTMNEIIEMIPASKRMIVEVVKL